MTRKTKQYDDDDGRTICDMNAAGMPWQENVIRDGKTEGGGTAQTVTLTRSETRLYTYNAILAGLMIAGVFAAFMILFTLFCTQIWLH